MSTNLVESSARSYPGAEREIAPRDQKLAFAADTPRHWMGGDPYLSNLMNAFSLTFPEGERFFIAAVRAFRERVQDPQLQRQVRGFLAQESLHRREHDTFNAWLKTQGFDVDAYYAEIEELLEPKGPLSPPIVRLAITCALEHFTAMLAETWLRRPEERENADPAVRALWTWHALEELDHKAVAFDVYQAVGGTYALRCITMLSVTARFMAKVASLHYRLMRADGQHKKLDVWLRGSWKCWGPGGYFSSLLPAYLRYFRPSFHPWEQDDSALVERFARELGFTGVRASAV